MKVGRIEVIGSITPVQDNKLTLGINTNRFKEVFIGQGTIHVTDRITGFDTSIVVDKGTLLVNGISLIGAPGIKFADGSIQLTASQGIEGPKGDKGDKGEDSTIPGQQGPTGPQGSQATRTGKVGYFASPSIIGNYSITGLGFRPKVINFVGHKNDGMQTWFMQSNGFADDQGNQNVSSLAGNFSNLF